MTIEFKELFGLGAVSDEAIEARAEQAKAEMLPSHWGRYDDVTLENGLKIIRQTYTDGWDENGWATHVRFTRTELGFEVPTEMSFLIQRSIRFSSVMTEMVLAMSPLSSDRTYHAPLPVHPVHVWLPRGLFLREEVRCKVFLLAEQIRLRRIPDDNEACVQSRAERGFIPLSLLLEEKDFPDAKEKVLFDGEVVESRAVAPIRFPSAEGDVMSEPLRLFRCRTALGEVCVLGRESLLSELSRALLGTSGVTLHASGPLIADARAGDYVSGAVWDADHFCSHLRMLAGIHCLRLVSAQLRRTTEIVVNGERKAEGVEPVIDVLRPCVYDINVHYARVRETKTGLTLPALLCRDLQDKRFRHWIVPEWNAEDASVTRFRVEERVGEFETLFETDDFVRFRDPFAPELHPHEEKSEAKKDAKSKYEFDGDADCFPEHHDEDASDFLVALLENDENFEEFVRNFLAEGVIPEEKKRMIEEVRVATIEDDGPKDEPGMTGVLVCTPDAKSWVNFMLMPRLPGLVAEAEVLGTCRWGRRVGGEVALAIGRAEVTAVVHDFDLVQKWMKPGDTRHFRLSASVESLEIRDPKPIVVDEGEFYEMELKKFLEKNPGKTRADFAPVEISTEGMVVLFPREYSTLFEFASLVLSVRKSKLCSRDVVRLEVRLFNFDDKEVRTYLYGAPSQIPEGLKEGCEVQGILRLYAEPIEGRLS